MEKSKRKRRGILTLVLLLIVMGAFGGYRLLRTDPNIKRVRDLRKEIASANASQLSTEQRREKFQQLRAAMDRLPPDQRDRMRREMAEDGRKRFEAEMEKYSKMSAAEKAKYLDERIVRMEERRQNFQASSNSIGSMGGNFASPSHDGRSQRSPEEREKMRKQMLDNTTPEFRAQRDQFFNDLKARQSQRGPHH